MKFREIRANYTDETIRVYQAYSPAIALPALEAGRFVSPFKMERMTWIKPSFCWMMYRCGYGEKPGQEYVLGIDITRQGFQWALEHALLSTYHTPTHGDHDQWKHDLLECPVRIQWDPERDPAIQKIEDQRSIQIGLTGEAVQRYVNEWIVNIEDVTPIAKRTREMIASGQDLTDIPSLTERPYPVTPQIAQRLRMDAPLLHTT